MTETLSRARIVHRLVCSHCGAVLDIPVHKDDPVICDGEKHYTFEEFENEELKKEFAKEIKTWSWD